MFVWNGSATSCQLPPLTLTIAEGKEHQAPLRPQLPLFEVVQQGQRPAAPREPKWRKRGEQRLHGAHAGVAPLCQQLGILEHSLVAISCCPAQQHLCSGSSAGVSFRGGAAGSTGNGGSGGSGTVSRSSGGRLGGNRNTATALTTRGLSGAPSEPGGMRRAKGPLSEATVGPMAAVNAIVKQ